MDEPTDLDPRIIDHPYQPNPWPDTCGYQYSTGWPCGYSEAEHEHPEGASEEVTPNERP